MKVMEVPCGVLVLLQLLGWISGGLGCFCERYPWGSWSSCSRTCNHGTQRRRRVMVRDTYFWRNSCHQLCEGVETRVCSVHVCPLHCVLGPFGPWSECSPCARKQFRTRSVLRPAQFGGSDCDPELTEERPCFPDNPCGLPDLHCKDSFKCGNGRCINSTLTCNRQNDCGDNSDEKDCGDTKVVCPAPRRAAPGVDLVGNGFDVLAEEPRGAVLDNMFMGGTCTIRRPESTTLYHRVPHNFHTFDIKVGVLEDFSTEPQPLQSKVLDLKRSYTTSMNQDLPRFGFLLLPLINSRSRKEVFKASKKIDSKFFRVHQVLPVSRFRVRDPDQVVLALPFLQFLHGLPLRYNYALYRNIFQRFGTHYYGSGTLGGHYDLLYQYSREELKSTGETEEHVANCLNQETKWSVVLYTQHSTVTPCTDSRMTQKFEGSYVKAAQKSFSQVKGGRTREAAALAWERQGPAPDRTSYKNWAKSVLDNPAVVEYKLLPIIDLVRGIPCAVTKRRNLRRALVQYLEEFDSCRCSPCPNNARAALSGTECVCVCQPGTFGAHCETRAPDFKSEEVDGSWSCWGSWSSCGASMTRSRSRTCDNPAPLRGGRPCQGPPREEDSCHVSLFNTQDTCDDDDDFEVGWRDELPPGVQGCLRPRSPDYSYLLKAKQFYNHGEDEEFQCFSGFQLEGFPFLDCLPDGSWGPARGRCVRKVCLPPELPPGMSVVPQQKEYVLGSSVEVSCQTSGLLPVPPGSYRCGESLTWEPPPPAGLRCSKDPPFEPDPRCQDGQVLKDGLCVCVQRDTCLEEPDSLCVLNVELGVAVSMSLCSFHAGRCHGDPLSFISGEPCGAAQQAGLDWAKFRAKMGSRSSVQEPCGLDTCYEWERCSASQQCVCRAARDCPPPGDLVFCVELTSTKRTRTLDLCSTAALTCASYQLKVLKEGACEAG